MHGIYNIKMYLYNFNQSPEDKIRANSRHVVCVRYSCGINKCNLSEINKLIKHRCNDIEKQYGSRNVGK
jgi:hypothetical protein